MPETKSGQQISGENIREKNTGKQIRANIRKSFFDVVPTVWASSHTKEAAGERSGQKNWLPALLALDISEFVLAILAILD